FKALAARQSHVRYVNATDNEPVQVSFSFHPEAEHLLTYELLLYPRDRVELRLRWSVKGAYLAQDRLILDKMTKIMRHAGDQVETWSEDGTLQKRRARGLALSALGRTDEYPYIERTFDFITNRWQLLEENFLPQLTVPDSQREATYGSLSLRI